ncbi:hypothetical protein GCM10011609_08920 [Lentzea pudingi]|uniref:Uncharacterized protein n=1 Tax=Lentzea pudingi TaxID=1789439 RepID=A0ABQ2HDC2_9PSEU|nr:hypothetical protein GCM10011609_08920 [Lentzea pudingi]
MKPAGIRYQNDDVIWNVLSPKTFRAACAGSVHCLLLKKGMVKSPFGFSPTVRRHGVVRSRDQPRPRYSER